MSLNTAPQKRAAIYGRDEELRILLNAYHRSSVTSSASISENRLQELVLIKGLSGSGKTAVASSLRDAVRQNEGYFLSGKFELTALQDPYAVFVSALTQFTNDVLNTSYAIEQHGNNHQDRFRQAIREAVGAEGRLVTTLVPALSNFLEKQPDHANDCEDVKGSEALLRFQLLFCKIFRALSTVASIVLFLDDLQWSDVASLELLQSILQAKNSNHGSRFLIVGAYREEGTEEDIKQPSMPSSTEEQLPFLRYLYQFNHLAKTSHLQLTRIHLQPLDEASTNKLVADFVGHEPESTTTLGQHVFLRCQGNPYYAIQLLNDFVSQGSLRRRGAPLCDLDYQHVLTSSVPEATLDELVCRKLATFPSLVKEVLQVAACIGDEIDEAIVAMVLDNTLPRIEMAMKAASAEGLLTFERHRGCFRFSHDRIRQGALSMVDDNDALSFSVGHRLWKRSSAPVLSEKLFVVANLLNHGIKCMIDQDERYKAASLNLEAGLKASSMAAFPDACRFFNAGIAFLRGGDFWSEQYELALSLFNAAADAAVYIQNFSLAAGLVDEVLENGRSLHDKLPAIVAQINSFGQHGNVQKAIDVGLNVLRQLDEPLPQQATKLAILFEVVKTKIALMGHSVDAILRLQPMESKEKLEALHVLTILLPYTYQAASFYNPLMGARIVRLAIKHGLHKKCASGFSTFGWVLCGAGDSTGGYRMGSLALSMVQKCRARELAPRVHIDFYGLIQHWKQPLRESLEPLQNAVHLGMEIGDVESAMIAFYMTCNHSFFCGVALNQVEKMLLEATAQMRLYKQDNMLQLTNPFLQLIHNLTGRAPVSKVLSGDIVQLWDDSYKSDNVSIQSSHYTIGAQLALLFKDFELANDITKKKDSLNFVTPGMFWFVIMRQTDALVAIWRVRHGLNTRKSYRVARQYLGVIKSKALDCPENFLFRQYLLEAELRSLKCSKGVDARVHALYSMSIEAALGQGFVQEAALASELAADYMSRHSETVLARKYWEEDRVLYSTWGATEKATHLSVCTGIAHTLR